MALVIDTSVVLTACCAGNGFSLLEQHRLIAPPLMWPEARSAIHETRWRGDITDELAGIALAKLAGAPIEVRAHRLLGAESWRLADELGWAKTYDSEFLALVYLESCKVLTLDRRLRRGADKLGLVTEPSEL